MKKSSIPVFKIRCSALGDIMSDARAKQPREQYNDAVATRKKLRKQLKAIKNKQTKEAQAKEQRIVELDKKIAELRPTIKNVVLSKTCITHLNNWVDEHVYHRPNKVNTWAMQKGVEKEIEALIIVNKALQKALPKDKRDLEDLFSTGHIDTDWKDEKTVIDIKVCEDFSTFPRFKTDVELGYYWQMQGYMNLLGYDRALVIKVLVNSPAWQIQEMIKRSAFGLLAKYGDTNLDYLIEHETNVKQIFAQHVFDDTIQVDGYKLEPEKIIPIKDRIKVFEIKRCQEDIDLIAQRVKDCRRFLNLQGYKQPLR